MTNPGVGCFRPGGSSGSAGSGGEASAFFRGLLLRGREIGWLVHISCGRCCGAQRLLCFPLLCRFRSRPGQQRERYRRATRFVVRVRPRFALALLGCQPFRVRVSLFLLLLVVLILLVFITAFRGGGLGLLEDAPESLDVDHLGCLLRRECTGLRSGLLAHTRLLDLLLKTLEAVERVRVGLPLALQSLDPDVILLELLLALFFQRCIPVLPAQLGILLTPTLGLLLALGVSRVQGFLAHLRSRLSSGNDSGNCGWRQRLAECA